MADEAGGLLEVTRAGIVTKAFPKFQDVLFVRRGEGGDRRKVFHPTFPVRDHSLDLRLLEHDFRNPDRVGIAGAPPRKIAGIFREPGGDSFCNAVERGGHQIIS